MENDEPYKRIDGLDKMAGEWGRGKENANLAGSIKLCRFLIERSQSISLTNTPCATIKFY